jgi:hypothetical protein
VGLTADPARGVFHSSVIIEISPGEFDRLQRGELSLPHGWRIEDELFPRLRKADGVMNWAQAFARQAASDLDARDVLVCDTSLPACHALHFLQMACEKLCKASMISAGTDPMQVQRSHASIAKHNRDHVTGTERRGDMPRTRDGQTCCGQLPGAGPEV